MNYELAKQLKDAGFPQLQYDGQGKIYPLRESNGDYSQSGTVYLPTLSELIEACGGNDIFQLNFPIRGKWNARSGIVHGEGDTIEESVAKLWLELNK